MKGFVYILGLGDGRYYVGSTNDVTRRFEEHQKKRVEATRTFLPLKLCFYREYESLKKARQIENHLKKQKRRDILERFMTNAWQDIW
ncbi:MAG: GIY-YIG nuclease family protein [Candidatus Absconditabacterales bacterium]